MISWFLTHIIILFTANVLIYSSRCHIWKTMEFIFLFSYIKTPSAGKLGHLIFFHNFFSLPIHIFYSLLLASTTWIPKPYRKRVFLLGTNMSPDSRGEPSYYERSLYKLLPTFNHTSASSSTQESAFVLFKTVTWCMKPYRIPKSHFVSFSKVLLVAVKLQSSI